MDRILIIDDEDAIADALSELLSWEGFEVAVAGNGEAGLRQIAEARPAAVLVDYMMPVLDGVSMLRRLRADPVHDHLPVGLMSAAPLAGVPGTELADEVLRKPFDSGELLAVVRRLVERGHRPGA